MTTATDTTAVAEITGIEQRWAEAERTGDVRTLDELGDEQLRLVGPFGYVLDRDQWLQRYATGDLETHAFSWDDVSVRVTGDTAVTIGTQNQRVSYRGMANDGAFRSTHVWVRHDGRWRLVSVHLNPGAPDVPPAPPAAG
jgi:ketosteroid isomerase-like protein